MKEIVIGDSGYVTLIKYLTINFSDYYESMAHVDLYAGVTVSV